MLKNTFIFTLAILFSCSPKKEIVDVIIHHAKICSVDSTFTIYESMAIKNGKIVEIGKNQIILNNYESEQTINVNGKFIFPGFIDAHCHFTGYATDLWKCDLTGTKSFKEILDKIKNYSKDAPMYWIYARGWDQNDWGLKEYPNKKELDKLFPSRPVFLKRIDGHAALVNQVALDLFGINKKTKVKGGSVELKDGKLTGILIDNAMDLVDKKIPIISDSLARKYYKIIEKKCFSFGLTQVHDCGVSEQTIELIDQEQKDGKLKIKIFALLQDEPSYYEKWLKKGVYKTERLTVGGFKLYADGALGSRGACLLKSYTDMPNWKGFLLNDSDRMYEIAQKLYKSNFQLCTHAIGDSANRKILKIYASTLKTKNNKRWRIEHAQVLNKSDLNYFNKYSIIPSVQPTHATSDMYWAKNRLGEKRIKEAYAYNDLLKAAGYIALGTDFPVEDISPFKTFYAAVARQDSNGFPTEGFQKENALSRKNALKGMTIWAAYANFAETKIGSLEKGKMGDFIILDTDLLSCDLKKIIKTKVLATYINGEKVY